MHHFIQKTGWKKDTTLTYTYPLSVQDTLEIMFTDIRTLRKEWFKSRNWLELV